MLSGTDSKNHDELPMLVGVLTREANPISSAMGRWSTIITSIKFNCYGR
jgi:hypothetical protein